MTKGAHDLPNGWSLSNIGEIYRVIGGGTPSTLNSTYWNGETPWITSADIGGVRDITISKYVSSKGIENSTTNRVPARTLLVVTRVGLGKIAISDQDMCFSQDLQGLVAPASMILSEYALYYLSAELQKLKFEGRGTTISGVTKKQLKDTPFPLAPFNEQRRIVAKIEKLFSELDKGVEALTTAREQLKAYRQSVLKHAFDGKMTADLRLTHKAWRNVRLGDELAFLTSGSRGWADYYAKSGDTFIRAQNLKYDRLDLMDIAYVKLPKGNTEGIRTRVQVGDVLVTITGANVTKTGIVDSNLGAAYVSQHVALCRPRPSIRSRFLYWYLLSEAHGRRQLNEAAYGAGKPGLNLDNIKSVAISLPSAQEQAIVVERIEAALSVEQSFSESIDTELQRTNALRQSILKQAFSGQLVAQDPTDEPAPVLLERIRAERKKANAKKPGRKTKITSNSKTGKRATA